MSGALQEIDVVGTVSLVINRYVIETNEGKRYRLAAIMPYQAVSVDYGTGAFADYVGKQARAVGLTDGGTIWRASLVPVEKKKRASRAKRV